MTSRRAFCIVLLIAAIPLIGWWTYGLMDLDEGYYAAVVGEMNRRGEWIVPYYNGTPWWEKPILLYWMAKPCVAWFGQEVGPRLPSVLSALAGYAFVFWWARRRLSLAAAQLAVLVLGTSVLWIALARMMMTDMALAVSFGGACLLFFESLVGDKRWRIAVGALLGIGVLAKGPVALLLFVPIFVWTWWRERELRPSFKGMWIAASAAFLAVVATWYLPAYLGHREEFVQKFLIEQNLNRFTGGDAAHTVGGLAGLVFFVPILLVGLFPWSLFVFGQSPSGDGTSRFLATCALVPFLFFTASSAKLPHYVLPCCIPIALLVADRLSFRWSDDGRRLPPARIAAFAAGAFFLCVAANLGLGYWYRASGNALAHLLAREVPAEANVAVFQLPRRQNDRGTGKFKLQETGLPSLSFYLDRVVLEAETLDQLTQAQTPLYVITRYDRLNTPEFAEIRRRGLQIERMSKDASEPYQLYRISAPVGVSSSATNPSGEPRR